MIADAFAEAYHIPAWQPGLYARRQVQFGLSSNGSSVLDNVVAWIDCVLDAVHEAGDHFIVLGQVRELDIARAEEPLLFFRGNLPR